MAMQDKTIVKKKEPHGDAELFVHLQLETAGAAPLLANADVAQAGWTALAARARMLRCRVLVIGGDASHLFVVFKFPASLSLRYLVEMARDSSAPAVARALSLERQSRMMPQDVWGTHQLHTLSRGDVPAAIAFVEQHIGPAAPRQITWPEFLREQGSLYASSQD